MARLGESLANGTQSGKQQVTLRNSALGFLSSPAKPSGSQSPNKYKRLKTIAAAGSSPSGASRSLSPPQRLSSHISLHSPSRKPLSDTAADDMDATADGNIVVDDVASPAAFTAPSIEHAPLATPAPTAVMEPSPEDSMIDVMEATPDVVIPRTGIFSSVRKTFFGGPRNGIATASSTVEQTVVSRKRSREPEIEDKPAPAEREIEDETEPANVTSDINNTTIQLGNQFEADVAAEEVRASSPVKEVVQVAAASSPGAAAAAAAENDGEINVATANNDEDTIEAAETSQPAAVAEAGEDDLDDPKRGIFVVESVIGHRPDPSDETLFHMQVCWLHDKPTWEPEQTIQEDAPEALFAYWNSVKGGRLGAMADKDLWHVLKIEKHKQEKDGAVKLLVCWIGSPDRSWEPEEQVSSYAHEHVQHYWAAKGGREKHVKTVAGAVKKGRGRPRKNPIAAEEAPKEPKEKKARQGRKKQSDEAANAAQGDAAPEKVTRSKRSNKDTEEQVNANGEPPKKRGRGRPRREPVS